VEMDGVMQQVETHLGVISQKCNSRTLNRKAQNYVAFDGVFKAQGKFHGQYMWFGEND
jgi:hypothetical protein